MSSSSNSSHSRSNISRDPSTHEREIRSNAIAPERLFKALVLNGHDLIPTRARHAVERCEILQGDGGVGTIKKITYSQGTKYRYAKYRIESIDPHNREVSIGVIEGEELSEKIEKITYEHKFLAAPGGGTVVKIIYKYYIRAGHDNRGVAEKVEYRHEIDITIFEAVEKHLRENPHVFN